MWAHHAAFGDDLAELPAATDRAILGLEKLTLPAVLAAYGARGWLALPRGWCASISWKG
jgi:hypothetical protein